MICEHAILNIVNIGQCEYEMMNIIFTIDNDILLIRKRCTIILPLDDSRFDGVGNLQCCDGRMGTVADNI